MTTPAILTPIAPRPEVRVLNVSEIAYAAQAALGVPFRRPILDVVKHTQPATPELLDGMWRGFAARSPWRSA